ncbi:LPXTG cell wall anchor domain-containing protein [Streptomyces bauhiniae]|uniref:LPXTG cell wall anchor domain-containing protein n=1 Tax=Streptomyces bauhiniae TaxID=2340725 RepID=A0A4Z1D6U3_9ACTN|nr:SCO1860 family LAETG-anchored protein [Streptomyces bauhiniae]TGN77635.1 LPXTG cell wall anchor domain-containing protein [Streptomyces bauhiniae]
MNSDNFPMPARRLAALATAAALTAAPLLLSARPAHATGGHGHASAAVLRAGLDVSLLHRTADVPLTLSLNEVQAPGTADRTALSARLDGVDQGRPFSVLRADVASARATATAERAEGSVRLADARLHVPGLPLLSLIEVGTVTARATCAAGEEPEAEANVLGAVTVLGKRTTLTAGGPTEVRVPGVGEVRLDLAEHRSTSHTAAATALRLKVSVNPLRLNVAEVTGTVTLAEASCETPAGEEPAPSEAPESAEPAAESPETAPEKSSEAPAPQVEPQGTQSNLAETGGSSATPYIAGGALALLLLGGGAVTVARRRRS